MQHDYDAFPNQRTARGILVQFPERAEIIVHRDRDLLLPKFGLERTCRFEPDLSAARATVATNEPVLRDIDTPWDIRKHAEARQPVSLGMLMDTEHSSFVQPLPPFAGHLLDMPIKFPHTDVRVPGELASCIPVIRRIVDNEAQLNPSYAEYYAYLSIHQGWVRPGQRQRETPAHVDGFQGPRWEKKHPANHSYLVSDTLQPDFYPVDFPLEHIDLNFDDIYAEFTRRIEQGVTTWSPRDLELILMDCYCVHRSRIAQELVFRTWLRVSWETRVFDRLGNTHNPLFDYDWKMVARDTDPRIRPRPLPRSA